MPPIDRAAFAGDEIFDAYFRAILSDADGIDMPHEARSALSRVVAADAAARQRMVANVLADAIPVEAIAEHSFTAAVLQAYFSALASQLDPGSLKPVGDGVCPCCGGAPASSLVVGWPGAEGTRFCACGLCGTLWNYVRARCTLCGSTKDISYRQVEGVGWNVKAEVCGSCRGYLKVLDQVTEPGLDPIADDIATLGLDILVREQGFRRGGFNAFLIGH